MRAIFDDKARYQRWLDIEAALARAQAAHGVIPESAARRITEAAVLSKIDLQRLEIELTETQHSLMPLIRGLARAAGKEAGEYVHFGPTTQDIEDTGGILEVKAAWEILFHDLRQVEAALLEHAATRRNTVMCGRTHGQQALPITLGLKFAIFAAEIRRHIERFKELRPRLFVGMLHGGVGSMAALGPKAFSVLETLMDELGLHVPDIGWATARDHLAEYVSTLALTGGTLGKVANEFFELGRTEIGEFSESLPEGYVGSSTMPHKRNPEICEQVVTLSRILRAHAGTAMEAVICENERDGRSWRIDWWTLPESSMMLGAMLAMMKKLLYGLVIHEAQIRKNLHLTGGLLLSEGLMFRLGEKIGKQTAHHVVGEACTRAFAEKRRLHDVVMESTSIREHLSASEIDDVLDYDKHVGFCGELVDRVLATADRLRKTDDPS